MLLTETVIEQAQLLLRQRLLLNTDRYTGLTQLTQHDYRLLDCLSLLHSAEQHNVTTAMPTWLVWLLNSSLTTLLSPAQLNGLGQSRSAWQLLLDLKYHQQPAAVTTLIEQHLQDNATSALVWQFAARHRLALTALLQTKLQTADLCADALCYLGYNGQRQLLPMLQQYSTQLSHDDTQYCAAQLAAYSLGQQSDEAGLVTTLVQTNQLTDIALMLLMIGATDTTQARIVNYLSANEDSIGTAMRAMAFSGQLKFVPLLLELSQQQNTAAAALEALTVLLGTLDADALVSAGDCTAFMAGKSRRKLAGFDIDAEQLAIVWRQGNPLQRQLVACYRFRARPGTALVFTDVLFGAPAYE